MMARQRKLKAPNAEYRSPDGDVRSALEAAADRG